MIQVRWSRSIVHSAISLSGHRSTKNTQVVISTRPKLEPLRCCEETRARNRSLADQWGVVEELENDTSFICLVLWHSYVVTIY